MLPLTTAASFATGSAMIYKYEIHSDDDYDYETIMMWVIPVDSMPAGVHIAEVDWTEGYNGWPQIVERFTIYSDGDETLYFKEH